MDLIYLEVAEVFARKSTCVSKQVGAVIVQNDRIISHGYNGTPSKMPHCEDVGLEEGWLGHLHDRKTITDCTYMKDRPAHSAWSEINEIHAEQNAIGYAARAGLSTDGATMYVTLSPCHNCAKMIVAAGIKQVVVLEVYDRAGPDWDKWLLKNNVNVHVVK